MKTNESGYDVVSWNASAECLLRDMLEIIEVMDARQTDPDHQLDYLYIKMQKALLVLEQWKDDYGEY